MKIFKQAFYFLVFTIISICMISCEDQESSNLIDLTLSLNSSAKTHSSKDISPTDDELTVFRFEINGMGPGNRTFSTETTLESTTLTNLVKGKWEISVVGFNVNDKAIVEGSGTYYLFNSKSVVDITLDYIVGRGNLIVDFYWDKDQADPNVIGLLTTLQKLENNEYVNCDIKPAAQFLEEGHAKIETELDCGSYIMSSTLMNRETKLSGFAEQVRILSNQTTVGSNTFIIGDTTIDYGINFYCNTYLPIRGVISASPEVITENQELTLTFTPTSIPDGYSAEDIRYCWYFEGHLLKDENSNVLNILPAKGQHRYDLFAYIDGISGTLGSTQIIVSCE